MIKSLTRTGNSYAVVLDRSLMELVHIDPEQPVEISTDDGKRLIISPAPDENRGKKFRAALARTNQKHGQTLKRLAQ